MLESQKHWVTRAMHRQRAKWGGSHGEDGGQERGREAGWSEEESVLGTVGKTLDF